MTVTGKETEAQLPRTLSETGSLCCSGQHCRARLALRSFHGVACLLPILLQGSGITDAVYRAWRYLGVGSMWDLGGHNEVHSLVQQALPR